MLIKRRQYPHPVLSYFSDDLVDCEFQTTLTHSTTKTAYVFNAVCKTSCRDLAGLIKDGRAKYAFHFECNTTRFRRLFASHEDEFSFEIPAAEIDGKVQICSFILAAQDIADYKISNFHSDFNNARFSIRKGDVLAVDYDRDFFAEKEIDPLKKIPSIFTVLINNSDGAPPYDYELGEYKIVIYLSKENFERYKMLELDQSLQTTMASLIIVPALSLILEQFRADSSLFSEHEEKRWFRVLNKKLEGIGIDIKNDATFINTSLVVAQQLIGDPVTLSLKALEALEGYESEE